MATVSAPNRSIIGLLFVVGGALQVLGAIIHVANAGDSSAIYAISNIAIGVGLALMFAWFATTTLARVGYFVGALGWLLLALTTLVNLGLVNTLAPYIAIVGSVFAGCMVITARPFAGRADILLFVALLLGAVDLLISQIGNVPLAFITLVVVAFGAALAAAGALMFRRG